MVSPSPLFAPRGSTEEIERGDVFQPKFGPDGLIPAIITDADTGDVLMFAWMNAEALALKRVLDAGDAAGEPTPPSGERRTAQTRLLAPAPDQGLTPGANRK